MKNFLNWLLCRLPRSWNKNFGHRKGKPTGEIRAGNYRVFQCPRCAAQWSRKGSTKARDELTEANQTRYEGQA